MYNFLKKWNIPQLTGDNVIKQLTNNFYKFWLMKEIEEHWFIFSKRWNMKFVKIILIVAVALTMALGGIYLMSEKKETTEIKAAVLI